MLKILKAAALILGAGLLGLALFALFIVFPRKSAPLIFGALILCLLFMGGRYLWRRFALPIGCWGIKLWHGFIDVMDNWKIHKGLQIVFLMISALILIYILFTVLGFVIFYLHVITFILFHHLFVA